MMNINIKTLKNEQMEVTIDENKTVLDLIQSMRDNYNISDDKNITIIFNGNILKNTQIIKDCNIDKYVVAIIKDNPDDVEIEKKEQYLHSNNNSSINMNIPMNIPMNMDSSIMNNITRMFQQVSANPELRSSFISAVQNEAQANGESQSVEQIEHILNDPNALTNILNMGRDMEMSGIYLSDIEKQDVQSLMDLQLGYQYNEIVDYYLSCGKNKETTAELLFNEKYNNEQINIPSMKEPTETTITDEDKQNIDYIIGMGFNPEIAKECYIKSNKNTEVAINMLLAE